MSKLALITGATRGVGKELAKMFQKYNYDVIITGRDANNAEAIAEELNVNIPEGSSPKGRATGYELDFTTANEENNKLLAELKNKTIKPTYLINNAGVLMLDNMKNITPKQLHIMFSVNTFGPMLLTKYCMEHIWEQKYGGILFNSPPYVIDDKTKYLMPYMQTKLAQTTFMHSLANTTPKESNVIVSSFWTSYPLHTDAILKRGVGKMEDCMHPRILSRTVEELLFNIKNREQYNGKEIIDGNFLEARGVDTTQFQMSSSRTPPMLDQLFLNHLYLP